MRIMTLTFCLAVVASAAFVTAFTDSLAQEHVTAPADNPAHSNTLKPRLPELSRLTLAQRQFYLASQRGADWLQRANKPDGRFVYGYLPTLRAAREGDDFLVQVQAAAAVARASRFFADEKAAAIAQQALLTLLLDTNADAKTGLRHTTFPSSLVNRLAASGLLVLAVHELPAPKKDVLDQAEQLTAYLYRCQQTDGSLVEDDAPKNRTDSIRAQIHADMALTGLVRSLRHRPGKSEVVSKAATSLLARWQKTKLPAAIPWSTAACAEAYLLTRDPALAQAVFHMNDWLCGLQYQQLDPRRPLWHGGFKAWRDGHSADEPPTIATAQYAESLAYACRVARQAGDATRYQRYRQALEKSLQFLTSLQYTDVNTQHFADWYRPILSGAFHASHQEGDLRLDHTLHAVTAMLNYLDFVVETP